MVAFEGGISTGEKIVFHLKFKPPASVLDIAKQGRHDPCIVPRAAVVVESMAWLVVADHVLWSPPGSSVLNYSVWSFVSFNLQDW